MNAYRLLNIWQTTPGIKSKGIIDINKLNNWYKEMKKLAIEKDRLEVSLLHFGEVLFYSQKEEGEPWIDDSIAALLNNEDAEMIRRGFSLQAINSVGVINADKDGTAWLKLEKEWKNKEQRTDDKYFRFKETIRDIAEGFHEEAEHMKEHYS